MSPEEWLATQSSKVKASVTIEPSSPEEFLASQTPATTTPTGVVGAITRGLAPIATGAAVGAALGAPLGGVGAIPGGIAGAGAAALTQMFGDPIVSSVNSILGTKYSTPSDAMEDLLSRVGVPEAKSAAERIVKTMVAGAGGGAGTMAVGQAMGSAVSPVARGVGQFLASNPVLSTVSGATAAGAGQLAKEEGAGMLGQLGATVAGAFVPSVPSIAKSLTQAARPISSPRVTTPPMQEPLGTGLADALPPTGVPTVTISGTTDVDVNSLVRKASGSGIGSQNARDQLADLSQINLQAKEAADRLGIQLPADVFSDSQQVRAAAGLTRSVAGEEPEAAWRNTVSQAVDKADDIMRQFDATFIEGTIAPGAVSQKIKDDLISQKTTLFKEAEGLYNSTNAQIKKEMIVGLPKLRETLEAVEKEVTRKGMSSAEKNLLQMVTEGKATYGQLLREKSLIGKALKNQESTYGSMAEADLKRLYAALSEDQLTNAFNVGGETLRKELRAANLLYAKERALGKRIVTAFGEDVEGSIANKMRSAITSASKGDTGDFNRLLKAVPKDLQKETLATALASATRSTRGAEKGNFGFSEFADLYPKLRANPTVYKSIVQTLGKDADGTLRDLFEISKRITDARANVLTTGKANQAFGNAEGLVGKVMDSSFAQRGATAVAGLVPGGGIIAPDIIKFMSSSAEANVKAAGKLFADEAFQSLAIEAATKGTASPNALNKTINSGAFRRFADAVKLPKDRDSRIQFLQSAIQSGQNIQESE